MTRYLQWSTKKNKATTDGMTLKKARTDLTAEYIDHFFDFYEKWQGVKFYSWRLVDSDGHILIDHKRGE